MNHKEGDIIILNGVKYKIIFIKDGRYLLKELETAKGIFLSIKTIDKQARKK